MKGTDGALIESKQVQLVLVYCEGPKVHIEDLQHHICNGAPIVSRCNGRNQVQIRSVSIQAQGPPSSSRSERCVRPAGQASWLRECEAGLSWCNP